MRPVSRRPAHITPPPKAAAAAAAPSGTSAADLGLEAEIFWDRHRIKVIGSLVLAVVGILGYSMFLYFRASALASANAELSAAKSIDEIKKVIADHSNSIVAADAYLVLAQKQSEARDFDAAAASAQALTEKFPDYPMRGAALLAVGANLEAGGKLGQADAAYKSATETVPADFAAPIALLARASLAKLRGNGFQRLAKPQRDVRQFSQTLAHDRFDSVLRNPLRGLGKAVIATLRACERVLDDG